MKKVLPGPWKGAYGAWFLALAGSAIMGAASFGASDPERLRLMLYWLLLNAACASILPQYALFPDRHQAMRSLLNPAPWQLYKTVSHQSNPYRFLAVIPTALIAFSGGFRDLSVWVLFLSALFLIRAFWVLSHAMTLQVGPIGQAWHEGTRGGWYESMTEWLPGFMAPRGLVPSLLVVPAVFGLCIVGTTSIMLWNSDWPAWAPIAGAILFLIAVAVLSFRGLKRFDRSYYATNAFYSEMFVQSPTSGLGEEENLPIRSLYWVPSRWRAMTWQNLLQFDRRLPLGRFVYLGLLVFLAMLYRDASMPLVFAFLASLSVARCVMIHMVSGVVNAPPRFWSRYQGVADWIWVRFFTNLRWMPVTLGAVVLGVLFDPQMEWRHLLLWLPMDILVSLLFAVTATLVNETRYRRSLA